MLGFLQHTGFRTGFNQVFNVFDRNGSLLLDLLSNYAAETAGRGGELLTVDALNLALAAGLVILVLLQVMPMSARLAGGFALATQGVVDRGVEGLRRAVRSLGDRSYTFLTAPSSSTPSSGLIHPRRISP